MENTKRNLLALSLVLPSMAQAFGLGEITVHSKLGEPLRAEIAVTDPSVDGDKLKLALADKDDFYRVGLELTPYLSGLQFRLVEQDDGSQVIEVTSQAAAREPFLSFLLEANWSSGRMLKEYTLLLDPPVFDTAGSGTASSQPTETIREVPADTGRGQEPVEPKPMTETDIVADSAPAVAAEPQPTVESYGSAVNEYEVQAGDTLWELAKDLRPDAGVDINTMMIALLETNPEAFIDNNINGLKRGAVLRVPNRAEIEAMGLEDALQLVREQNALWQQYRGQMAERPTTVSDATGYTDTADVGMDGDVADAELRLVPPASEDEERASVNAAGTAASEELAMLEDELNRTREELAAKEQETAELASRVSELEALVDKLERAINIKDADLAALQAELEAARAAMNEVDTMVEADAATETETELADRVAEESAAGDEPAETPADAQATEEAVIADETLAGLIDTGDAEPLEEEPQEDEFSLAGDMGDGPIAAEDMVEEAVTEADGTLPAEENLMDTAESGQDTEAVRQPMDEPSQQPVTLAEKEASTASSGGLFGLSWTTLAAIGGGVLLLLILLVLKKRSGKEEEQAEQEQEQPQPQPQDEPELEEEAETGEEVMAAAAESEVNEDTDRTETETVEPVIALDDEEEPDLSQLPLEDGEDVDLSDIYEGSDVEHPELERADSDELELDSLFEETEAETGQEEEGDSDEETFDFELELDEELETAQEVESAVDAADELDLDKGDELDLAKDDELDLDKEEHDQDELNLDLQEDDLTLQPQDEGDADSAPAEGFDLDFELDEETTDQADEGRDGETQADAPQESSEMDVPENQEGDSAVQEDMEPEMDMELELEAGEEESKDELDMFDDEDAEEELDIPTDDLFEDEDAVATKLDLARAYLDMGDPDGARTMLEEVVQEGNEEQKAQAQELLDGMK